MKQNKTKAFIIGVTGGVGSGKSRVLDYAKKHYPVRIIRADDVGKELMEPGKCVYQALVDHYGSRILKSDGSLDRKILSDLCFGSRREQEIMNTIEHPLIRDEILRRIRRTRKPAILLEAALLVEGGLTKICNALVYVQVSDKTRIERLQSSRGYTEEKTRRIMDLQYSEKAYLKAATDVILNDGAFSETEHAFDRLMEKWGIEKIR